MANIFHINSANIPFYTTEEMFSNNPVTMSRLLVSNATQSLTPTNYTLLQLNGQPDLPARMSIDTNNGSGSFGSSLRFRRTHGDAGHPRALLDDDSIMQLVGDGWDSASMVAGKVSLNFFAESNWNTSSQPTYLTLTTTPSNMPGNTTAIERLRINSLGNITATGSIVALGGFLGTSSYSTNTLSASSAPANPIFSASISTQFGTKQDTLVVGGLYSVTSSWTNNILGTNVNGKVSSATTADSASYVLASNVDGKVNSSVTADTASYVTSSNVVGTVANATNAGTSRTSSYVSGANISGKVTSAETSDTASYISSAATFDTSTYQLTSSWAISASWAPTQQAGGGTTLFTGSTYPITSSWANNAVTATTAITANTSSYISASSTFDKSVYQNTSSWAGNAQNITSSGVSGTISNALNAGFASQAVQATSSLSASYVTSSNVIGTVGNATNAGTALTASYVTSSNVFGTVGNATNAGFAGQAVQATSSLSASYVTSSNVFGTVTQALNAGFSAQAVQSTSSLSASFVTSSNVFGTVGNATNAGFSGQSVQSTSSLSASYITSSNVVGTVGSALTSSWITSSGVIGTVGNATNAGSAISASNLAGFSFGSISTTLVNTLTASAILTVSTASYLAAFFDYAVISSSNTRAGSVFGSWLTNGSTTYTEVTTTDIGTTQDVTMSFGLGSNGTVQLSASSVTFGNWSIRALGRFI